jgi:Fe2+ or Zn2+ uptake regulation protein
MSADPIRAGGRRLTRQRAAIWDAVSGADGHVSAEQIVERAQASMPSLSPSTVYRTLDVLVGQGLVLRTDLGGDRAYYEPAREHRHHHVVCERCGEVRHLHDEALGELPARIESDTGYRLGNAEITFFGLCPECR